MGGTKAGWISRRIVHGEKLARLVDLREGGVEGSLFREYNCQLVH